MMREQVYDTLIGGPESEKLLELRAKTDRQIRNIIEVTLNAGLAAAVLAEAGYSRGEGSFAELSADRARRALDEARRLRLLLRQGQISGFDTKVKEIQRVLDRLPCQVEYARPHAALRAHCA
jgi:hypothetical protein